MKSNVYLIVLSLLLVFTLNTFAQNYTKWDLPAGAIMRYGNGRINAIAYSPDGTRLAVASSIGIWFYDAETAAPLDLLTGHASSVNSVVFSPDGQLLASGSHDATVRLWHVRTNALRRTLAGHTERVNSVAFSPDEQLLATGSVDTIHFLNVKTNERLPLSKHTPRDY